MKLDYSALNRSITKDDIEAYYEASGNKVYSIRTIILVTIGVYLVLAIALAIMVFNAESNKSLDAVVLATVIVPGGASCAFFLITLYIAMKQKAYAKLYAFVRANNLEMIIEERNPSYTGVIFGPSSDSILNEALFFPDGVEIGNYRGVSDSDRGHQTNTWGYVRVRLNLSCRICC